MIKHDDDEQSVKLWTAVLIQAVKDLSDTTSQKAYIRRTTRLWFNQSRNTGMGCFLWICELLTLDPDKTRAAILKNHKLVNSVSRGTTQKKIAC